MTESYEFVDLLNGANGSLDDILHKIESGIPFHTESRDRPEIAGQLGGITMGSVLELYDDKISLLDPVRTPHDINPGEALQAYSDGWTLYFRNIHRTIPMLAALLDSMSEDLGFMREYLACEAFASKESSGAAMHADYDINFAYLVRGNKKWSLSKLHEIPNPPSIVLPGGNKQTQKVQSILDSNSDIVLPSIIPEDEQMELKMTSGSLLHLPRGWWHKTTSEGECLQVNFVVKGPQFVSQLGEKACQALEYDSELREFIVSRKNTTATTTVRMKQLAERAESLLRDINPYIDMEYTDTVKQLLSQEKS
jgi:ribosomal protein L16 Arg81 hydroxylase